MPNNDNRDNDNRTKLLIVRQWLAMQRDNDNRTSVLELRALAKLRHAADLIGEVEHILDREKIFLGCAGPDAWRDAYNLKNLLTVLIGEEVECGK